MKIHLQNGVFNSPESLKTDCFQGFLITKWPEMLLRGSGQNKNAYAKRLLKLHFATKQAPD
jgi:hypothetical protein